MANLLEHANPEQLSAITHREGPLMIVAGAGTGKTSVITQRIAWLIEQGLATPENILALTFTDKAAGEMEERVDLLLPFGYANLQISTFHAFAETVLREWGVEIGLAKDFKLLAELDAWLLTRQHWDRFKLDYYRPMGNPTKYLRGLLSHFSRAKDAAITPAMYRDFVTQKERDMPPNPTAEEQDELVRAKELAGAYETYQAILQENDACDFGDLMVYLLELLRRRPRALNAIRARFTYVLVDEFQDTNQAQYEIVKLVAAPRNNLTIVGDDDQAIYKFRGASIENILRFSADYPTAKKIVLTRNYRSVQPILDRAHGFIQANNPRRLEASDPDLNKKLRSEKEGEGKVEHLHFPSLDDEVDAVAMKILELKELHPDAEWSDFGILVRGNDAANPFLGPLERAGIPYRFMALSGLYTKRVLLDLLAFLRVIDDPFDSPSTYRLLTLPIHGIPVDAIVAASHEAHKKGKSLTDACEMVRAAGGFAPAVADKIGSLLSTLAKLREDAPKMRITEFFLNVAKETGYLHWLNQQKEQQKMEDFRYLQQFYQRLKKFEERQDHPVLRRFLEEFKHERDAGEDGALGQDVEAGPDVVSVMTVHGSKGLEFRFVFVVSLVDRKFPAQARAESIPLPVGLLPTESEEGDPHLEEERRLFYVAVTRAKEHLYFTSAEDYGGTRKRKPSRFLVELGYVQEQKKLTKKERDLAKQIEDAGKPPEPVSDEMPVIEVPKAFSFTQLAAFATCPLQYKFAHVYKIPIFGSRSMSFGKTVHNALQQFFQLWIERTVSSPDGSSSPLSPSLNQGGGALPVSLVELESFYRDHWQDDWYRDDKEREEFRQQGLDMLRRYYATLPEAKPDPLFLEQAFTLKVAGVILKGRIDRIDRCGEGVEIIDYKTGSPKTEDDLKKDKTKKEQLYLYQLAARDVLGLDVKKLTFHYLEDGSRVSFLAEPGELLTFQEELADRVERIKRGVLDATPGFHCRFCDFKDICEFRQKE